MPVRSPHIPPGHMRAWRGFLTAASTVVDRLGREMEEETGLPLTWYEVLLYLREAEGGRLRMHELADSLLLSRSAVTRFVDRMEEGGLVRRTDCPDDRRGTFVEATPLGIKRFMSAAPVHLRGISEHFAGLIDDGEAAVIASAMERVSRHLA